MKLIQALLCASAVFASAIKNAGPSDEMTKREANLPSDETSNIAARAALALQDLEDLPIAKRACVSNGCRCATGYRQGQYCGSCGFPPFRNNVNTDWMIRANRVKTNVYECSPAGACCSYGRARDCGTNRGIGRCGSNS